MPAFIQITCDFGPCMKRVCVRLELTDKGEISDYIGTLTKNEWYQNRDQLIYCPVHKETFQNADKEHADKIQAQKDAAASYNPLAKRGGDLLKWKGRKPGCESYQEKKEAIMRLAPKQIWRRCNLSGKMEIFSLKSAVPVYGGSNGLILRWDYWYGCNVCGKQEEVEKEYLDKYGLKTNKSRATGLLAERIG